MVQPLRKTDERIRELEGILVYTFKNETHLHQALQLPGSMTAVGNKGLAQVGKAAFDLVLISEGHSRKFGPDSISGVLTTMASKSNFAEKGFQNGLDKFIHTNPSQAGLVTEKPMGNTVQALLGAVFVDSHSNLDAVRKTAKALGLGVRGKDKLLG